jgi:hypothetical protein
VACWRSKKVRLRKLNIGRALCVTSASVGQGTLVLITIGFVSKSGLTVFSESLTT